MMIGKRTALPAFLLAALTMNGQDAKPALWSLRPVLRPEIAADGKNPIDRLMARRHAQKGLRAAGRADKATLLRRVYLDVWVRWHQEHPSPSRGSLRRLLLYYY